MLRIKIILLVLLLYLPLVAGQNRLLFTGIFNNDSQVSQPVIEKLEKELDADLFSISLLPLFVSEEIKPYKEQLKACKADSACLLAAASKLQPTLLLYGTLSAVQDGTIRIDIFLVDNKGEKFAHVTKQGAQNTLSALLKQGVVMALKQSVSSLFEKGYKGRPSLLTFPKTEYSPIVHIEKISPLKQVPVVTSQPPSELTTAPQLPLTATKTERELLNSALRLDRLADPEKALASWDTFLAQVQDKQIGEWAKKRANEWRSFLSLDAERQLFLDAVKYEKDMSLFPDKIYLHWQEIASRITNEAYKQVVTARLALYAPSAQKIELWKKERRAFERSEIDAFRKIEKIFSENAPSFEQQYLMLTSFWHYFAPLDAAQYVEKLLALPSEKEERDFLLLNFFNPLSVSRYKKECNENNINSCFVAVDIYQLMGDTQKYDEVIALSCSKGVSAHCTMSHQKDSAVLTKSCLSLDAVSCFLLAKIEPKTPADKNNAKASILLNRACELGYTSACETEKKVQPIIVVQKKSAPRVIIIPQPTQPLPPPTQPLPPPKALFTQRHPYFWYGLPLFVSGLALGGVSTYFFLEADHAYASYNQLTDADVILDIYQNGTKEEMIHQRDAANKALDDGDKNRAIAISMVATGGAMAITGIILMALEPKAKKSKKKAEIAVPLQLVILPNGAFASATFKW